MGKTKSHNPRTITPEQRESRRIYSKKHYRENPDYYKKYWQDNAEKRYESSKRHRLAYNTIRKIIIFYPTFFKT